MKGEFVLEIGESMKIGKLTNIRYTNTNKIITSSLSYTVTQRKLEKKAKFPKYRKRTWMEATSTNSSRDLSTKLRNPFDDCSC